MDWYKSYKIIKTENGYVVEIYLNNDSEEFSKEFFTNIIDNAYGYRVKVSNFIKDKFENIKISSVKLIVGSLVVATIPFASLASMNDTEVKAADSPSSISSQNAKVFNATGTVTASQLNVRQGPSTNYSVIHTLWRGNVIKLIGSSNGWYKIQLSDGRIGWVSSSYINNVTYQSSENITPLSTRGIVTASKLNVRSGPSTSHSVIHLLWKNNNVKVIGRTGNWYKIQLTDGRTGFVSGNYLKIDSRDSKINTVISTAKSLIGTPYVWGGESLAEGGFDCSGFTQYVYRQAGVELNRLSQDQAKQGDYVSKSNLQPGDLIFSGFNGDGKINHVGIYIGSNQMIHSPKTGDVVKVTDMSTPYWNSVYVISRRII